MSNGTLIGICFAFCLVACATSPPAPQTGSARAAASTKAAPGVCVTDTGTRIPATPDECTGPGRVWTYQDVKSTGATDAAQALRQLDPTVTISH